MFAQSVRHLLVISVSFNRSLAQFVTYSFNFTYLVSLSLNELVTWSITYQSFSKADSYSFSQLIFQSPSYSVSDSVTRLRNQYATHTDASLSHDLLYQAGQQNAEFSYVYTLQNQLTKQMVWVV
jgi:hypothetical protein